VIVVAIPIFIYFLIVGWLVKSLSFFEVFSNDILNNRISQKQFLITLCYSIQIEFTGMAHLYIAMVALQYNPSLFAAFLGYIISVVFLIVSPFLRCFGAIEVSMVFVLVRFGYSNIEAVAVPFVQILRVLAAIDRRYHMLYIENQ